VLLVVSQPHFYVEGTADGAIVDDVLFSVVVVFADVVVFVGVGGIPHIFDSVSLTNLSLGSHIAAFCSGVNDDVILFPWP
jgi:hypothetical protein